MYILQNNYHNKVHSHKHHLTWLKLFTSVLHLCCMTHCGWSLSSFPFLDFGCGYKLTLLSGYSRSKRMPVTHLCWKRTCLHSSFESPLLPYKKHGPRAIRDLCHRTALPNLQTCIEEESTSHCSLKQNVLSLVLISHIPGNLQTHEQ